LTASQQSAAAASSKRSGIKHITAEEIEQRVLCIDGLGHLFPEPGQHFDLWHEGIPWASRVRAEPCPCDKSPELHTHHYLEGGEIHAGFQWTLGSTLHFTLVQQQLHVDGDLTA
jgi:hypothetical protein